jgi:hypothetical protein
VEVGDRAHQLVTAERESPVPRGRFGLVAGPEPELPVPDLARPAQLVERDGFEYAFFSETMATNRDSVTEAAVLARVPEYRAAGVDVPLLWPARGTSIEAVLRASATSG